MRDIDTLVVHHSASHPGTPASVIRAWHIARGWSDIGYHWVIEGDGECVTGRPLEQAGAHVRGLNGYTAGVCLTGDNTKPDMGWSSPQIERLCALIASVRVVFPQMNVCGHRDLAETECPGLDVGALLTER